MAQFVPAVPWFWTGVAFLLGACVGSFLNVVICRLPKEEPIFTSDSRGRCSQRITWRDTIPGFSLLRSRGRLGGCGQAFSVRYPFVELLTGLLFFVCFVKFPPLVAMCGAVFLSALIAATFIDLDHFIIPDVFTIGLAVVGLLLSLSIPALHGQNIGSGLLDGMRAGFASIVGMLIGSAVVLWIGLIGESLLKQEAMGFGDVKFVGAIGAFCGWQGAVFSVLGGSVVFLVWFAVGWVWERTSGRRAAFALPSETPEGEPTDPALGAHIPFGPMLAIAAALYFLVFRGWVSSRFAGVASLL